MVNICSNESLYQFLAQSFISFYPWKAIVFYKSAAVAAVATKLKICVSYVVRNLCTNFQSNWSFYTILTKESAKMTTLGRFSGILRLLVYQ